MVASPSKPRRAVALVFGLTALAPAAAARINVDHEGSVRAAAMDNKNPVDKDLYPNSYESSEQVLVRESLKAKLSHNIRAEFNAYALFMNTSDKTSLAQSLLNVSDEVNRSAALERHWYKNAKLDGFLTLDRLNIQAKIGSGDVTIGRFPINLTVMGIFTPNDMFAPYRPFDYNREYKPGVDAVRLDHKLGRKGQISAIAVAGYETSGFVSRVGANSTGSTKFSATNAAGLVRATYTVRRVDLGAFVGKVGLNDVVGASLQGELGPVGLRAEGQQKVSRVTPGLTQAEAAVGADYRLGAKWVVTGEQFYNGSGYPDASGYANLAQSSAQPQFLLGQLYSAVAFIYEATPLLHLRGLVMANDGDRSLLTTAQLSYSLAERAELGLAVVVPFGPPPVQLVPKSEFGLYPTIVSLQTAVYF